MLRLAVSLLFAATAGNAIAQTTAPPIAYAKLSGGTQEIYVVNPDGSGSKKIYSSGNKRNIAAIDLKPGGGEIAWIEAGGNTPFQLKVLTLDGAGSPVGPARVLSNLCFPNTVDYHPSSSVLILAELCSGTARISTIKSDGTGYAVLRSFNGYIDKPRWLADGSSYIYIYDANNGTGTHICRNDCDPAANDRLATLPALGRFDVARTRNAIIYDNGNSFISELNLDTGVITSNIVRGTDPHFAPTDRYVLYETPHEAKGDYLMIYDSVTNSSSRLSGKGEYTGKDWRPN